MVDKKLDIIKNYKILYCEDNKDLTVTFSLLLKEVTNNIIYAKDGIEGLELYKKEKPDIIITDINMPRKDGIEMIKDIRKLDSQIPIGIITAQEDQSNLVSAIELGVKRFLFKPVRKKTLVSVIKDIVFELEDKRLADEYRAKQEIEKLNKNTKNVISQFSEVFIEPIMIIQNGKIKHLNKAFEKILDIKDIELLLQDSRYFDNLLEKKEGFCSSLNKFNEENHYKNKISIIKNDKRRIFQVILKRVYFEGEKDESIVYTFENITFLEYQKLKIQNYSERLEDFIIASRYKKCLNNYNTEDFNKISDIQEEKRKLDIKEESLLRKSRVDTHKISSKEFINSLDDYMLDDLDEIKDCEKDIESSLFSFSTEPSKKALDKVVFFIEKYANAIKVFVLFNDLVKALTSVCDIFKNTEDLDESKYKEIKMFLENIFYDLKKWRVSVFEDKSTTDIHYLDSSLFASCLQLELSLTGVKPEDEGEDDGFEFF